MFINDSKLTSEDIARRIDYAILNREYGWKPYAEGCAQVRAYRFAGFHVLPAWVKPVVAEIGAFARENSIDIGAPVAFPYGAAASDSKLREAECLISHGATALDMVANIGWLKDQRYADYLAECTAHARLCHDARINAKIIIEVGYLDASEIDTATKLVIDSGADFVKTATGTGPAGRPHEADVRLIRETIRAAWAKTMIKVSGISEPRVPNAYAFLALGADRLGTRAGPEIVDAFPNMQKAGALPDGA